MKQKLGPVDFATLMVFGAVIWSIRGAYFAFRVGRAAWRLPRRMLNRTSPASAQVAEPSLGLTKP